VLKPFKTEAGESFKSLSCICLVVYMTIQWDGGSGPVVADSLGPFATMPVKFNPQIYLLLTCVVNENCIAPLLVSDCSTVNFNWALISS